MKVVTILDTGIFRAIGKPPNDAYSKLKKIVTQSETEIRLPRPIYAELGGDPTASDYPSGSDYVDQAISEGWITVAEPIADASPLTDAIRDARSVMESSVSHGKTTVFAEDLSLIGLTMHLFERAESIHINLFTTDRPLQKAAAAVVNYYGYYDFDVYFSPPQSVVSSLLHPSHFNAGYRST